MTISAILNYKQNQSHAGYVLLAILYMLSWILIMTIIAAKTFKNIVMRISQFAIIYS